MRHGRTGDPKTGARKRNYGGGRYRTRYELVTSDFVIAEFLRAPAAKSANAQRFFEGVTILDQPARLESVIEAYVKNRLMPEDATGDAAHLAIASLHSIEFILTWNCRHLANANKVRHMRSLNARLRLKTPIITTPFELIPE